ncbi:hypothetical protein [Streptomyces sp. NPDC003697]
MIMTRSSAITAAVAAAAALTATGITYASASVAPAPQAAPAAVHQALAPAQAPMGGDVGGNNNGGGNDRCRGGDDDDDRCNERGKEREEEGWIHINERSYNARPGGCVTVVSGLGSRTLNIRNDSKKTVEVFRGATCDNGAPIATVGPRSSSNGVRPGCTEGVRVKDGIVGSFRVIHDHRGGKGGY